MPDNGFGAKANSRSFILQRTTGGPRTPCLRCVRSGAARATYYSDFIVVKVPGIKG
jgi:hypothetical protein